MDASSDDSFLRDHEYISRRVQWQLGQNDTPETRLTQFYHRLGLEPGKILVIWDNADHPSNLITFAGSLPITKTICILITSRNVGFSHKFAEDTGCIHLPDFPISDSMALLGATIGIDTASDTLKIVADQLGGLPLAISQAGAYMSQHHISPLEYKLILDKTRKDLSVDRDYDASFSHTIEISLDHLQQGEVPALKTLYFMSMFDASHIPKYLLLNQSLDSTTQISMKDLDGYIASLLSYSLVHLTQDRSCLDLHRLVRDVIRRRLYRNVDLATWESTALKAVSCEFPQGSFEEWEKCNELLPHALVVLKCDVVKDDENSIYLYKLLKNAGSYTMKTGRYAVAEKLLQEAYLVSMRQYGLDSFTSQSVATLLARLFLLMGRLTEAEELEVQVLESRRRALGEEHPDTLSSMSNLASIYRDQGRWTEAEALEVQALTAGMRLLGKEHPATLTSMANLASTYRDLGRWKEAEELEVRLM